MRRKRLTPILLIGIIVLAAILGIRSINPGGASAPLGTLSLDMTTSGNSAGSVGTIDASRCAALGPGGAFTFDLVLQGIPSTESMGAFNAQIVYDPAKISITDFQVRDLAPGAQFFLEKSTATVDRLVDSTDLLPDTDGTFFFGGYQLTTASGNDSDGLLARVTANVVVPGTINLDLVDSGRSRFTDINFTAHAFSVLIDAQLITDAVDTDSDGRGDVCDNCPLTSNPAQIDTDGDGLGNACDPDDDNDGLTDVAEGMLGTDPLDPDTDADTISDGPSDPDGAGPILAGPDNCPFTANPAQTDTDSDGQGNACDPDDDNDGWYDVAEASIGTLPLQACGGADAWPADTDGNGIILSSDVFFITSRFFLNSSSPSYLARADIGNLTGPRDGIILSNDVFAATSRFFTSC